MTQDKDEKVEPTYDDLADTISANLRTMKVTAIRLDALNTTVEALFGFLCVIGLLAAFLIIVRVRKELNQ